MNLSSEEISGGEFTPLSKPEEKKQSQYTEIFKATKSAITEWSMWEMVIGLSYVEHSIDNEKFKSLSADEIVSIEQLKMFQYFARLQENLNTKSAKDYIKSTAIPQKWVLGYQVNGTSERNGYAMILDHSIKKLCLYVNGTQGIRDMLHDLNSDYTPFLDGYAHLGMSKCAMKFDRKLKDIVSMHLKENPGYKLLLIGHSLGAGVAILLGMYWKKEFDLECIGFACPAIVSQNLAESCKDYVTTFINGDDFVPRFSIASFTALKQKIPPDWQTRFMTNVNNSENKWVKWLKKYGFIKYIFNFEQPMIAMSNEAISSMEDDMMGTELVGPEKKGEKDNGKDSPSTTLVQKDSPKFEQIKKESEESQPKDLNPETNSVELQGVKIDNESKPTNPPDQWFPVVTVEKTDSPDKMISENTATATKEEVEKKEAVPLMPAGKIIHLKNLGDKVYCCSGVHTDFTEMILSGKWMSDHMMSNYKKTLNEYIARRKVEEERKKLPPPPKIVREPTSGTSTTNVTPTERKLPPPPIHLVKKQQDLETSVGSNTINQEKPE